ncbi:hypothetical protein [Ottowia sp.]|uniref:prealbumin-like fold domain-containing protein n=1 Tax=Ottowia sp. TaxID=1898956 RepID=UPI002B50D3D9|nr:hypothetical protein [Ottowia sp.]HOB67524.1 hypothetical protein [Ottowia sp.]HPZ58227.1 hypothetical protein [Ottowia sp.]HQD48203.1 hypothetical protein [Ottowia sp.]
MNQGTQNDGEAGADGGVIGIAGRWAARGARAFLLGGAVMASWHWAQAQMDPNFVSQVACSAADLNCTANDLKNIVVTVAAGAPTSCVIGSTINVPVNIASSDNSNTRYDIGAWFRVPGTTNQCNAYITRTTGAVGFADHERGADTCGDLSGDGNQTFQNVPVSCQPSAGGNLNFPTTVFWSHKENGASCIIAPGTVSKCSTVATVQNMQFQGTITVKKTATGGTFPFTLTGQPAFNLNGGGQQRFTLNASAAGTNYTITEGATAGWTSNGVTCTSGSGTQTWQSATPTITVPLSYTHSNITCEFVNTPTPVTGQVILSKTLTANDPGVFTYTLTGTSGVTSGGSGDKLTATGVTAGTTVTFTETAQSPAVAGNYATTWACTGTGVSASGTGTSGSFTMPNPAVGVNCSFNNQRKQRRLYVNKVLTDASATPGKFDLWISGLTAPVASGVGTHTDSTGTLLNVGSTVTVSEAAAVGAPALDNFTSTLNCDATAANSIGISGEVTMPDADVTCTFTNTRKQATLKVAKAWAAGFNAGDQATVSTTGFTNVATSGVSTAGAGVTGAAIIVYAGESGQLTETLAAGTMADYAQTYACSGGGSVDASGHVGIPAADAGKAITCTLTNLRRVIGIDKHADVAGALAPGGTIVYTVTVSNLGGVQVDNVAVSDPVATGIASQTWGCVGTNGATCTASGSGAINDPSVSLPVTGLVTYTITATADTTLPAQVTNTATATPPAGTACLVNGAAAKPCAASASNRSVGAISVAKTTNVTGPLAPGGSVTYKVTVTNTGVVPVNNVAVSDPVPAGIVATQSWSCAGTNGATCAASGTGAINESSVSLPVGGVVTYTITATAANTLPAQVTNTVTVTPPPDARCFVNGQVASPCSVSVSNQSMGAVSVTKTSSVTGPLSPGGSVVYTVAVLNTSAVAVTNVAVSDPVPAGIVASQTWTCAGTGAACPAASGSGAITDTIASMPAGSSVTYTITATAASTLPPQVTNTVTVTPPTDVQCYIDGKVASPCAVSVSNPPTPPEPPRPPVAAIPTTSPEGLIALALMMLGAAGWASRRARQRR